MSAAWILFVAFGAVGFGSATAGVALAGVNRGKCSTTISLSERLSGPTQHSPRPWQAHARLVHTAMPRPAVPIAATSWTLSPDLARLSPAMEPRRLLVARRCRPWFSQPTSSAAARSPISVSGQVLDARLSRSRASSRARISSSSLAWHQPPRRGSCVGSGTIRTVDDRGAGVSPAARSRRTQQAGDGPWHDRSRDGASGSPTPCVAICRWQSGVNSQSMRLTSSRRIRPYLGSTASNAAASRSRLPGTSLSLSSPNRPRRKLR